MSDDLRERVARAIHEANAGGHISWDELHEVVRDQFYRTADAALAEMGGVPLQGRVSGWMQECFGPEISADRLERGDRLLEEVFELLQSGDYPKERVDALRDYVWSRPKGEPEQEVGGVMITLAAYCLAHEINMHNAGEREIDRVTQPEVVLKIRAKQAAKPTGSALPIAAIEPTPDSMREAALRDVLLELVEEVGFFLRSFDVGKPFQADRMRDSMNSARAIAEGKDDE